MSRCRERKINDKRQKNVGFGEGHMQVIDKINKQNIALTNDRRDLEVSLLCVEEYKSKVCT